MKKVFLMFSVVTLLLVTGCDNTSSGVMTCINDATPSTGVKLNSTYTIYYEKGYVTKLKTSEEVETDDSNNLLTYKDALEKAYAAYNDVDYYSNVITIEGNTLISSTVVNYEKVDTDKLISVDESNASLIKNGKVKIDDIKTLYQDNGATCK